MTRSYEEFEIEVSLDEARGYLVRARSSYGNASAPLALPFTGADLQMKLKDVQIAVLSSDGSRLGTGTAAGGALPAFGSALYQALFAGKVGELYQRTAHEAEEHDLGVRLRLRIQDPNLTLIPWEYLYADDLGGFLSLVTDTPIIRSLDVRDVAGPVLVEPPLRILGMIASPSNLPAIEIDGERAGLEGAVSDLQGRHLVEFTWVEGQGWEELRRAVRKGGYHVLHFMGHGEFDPVRGEGLINFTGSDGQAYPVTASKLRTLLAGHNTLRLVVLNSCVGAQSDGRDLFSSTAAALARGDIPAVVAMQYPITNGAASQFAAALYESLAECLPIDAAVDEGRRAISLGVGDSLEWGIPVLYMNAPDGRLFSRPAGLAPQPLPQPATPLVVSPLPVPVLPAPQPTPLARLGAWSRAHTRALWMWGAAGLVGALLAAALIWYFLLRVTLPTDISILMGQWDAIHHETDKTLDPTKLSRVLTKDYLAEQREDLATLERVGCFWEFEDVEPARVVDWDKMTDNQYEVIMDKHWRGDFYCGDPPALDEEYSWAGPFRVAYHVVRVGQGWRISDWNLVEEQFD